MSRKRLQNIDRYLNEADAHVIPEEFVTAACVTNLDGEEYFVTLDEVTEILSNGPLDEQGIESVRAIVNMEKIKLTVLNLSNSILASFRS